MRGYLGNIDIEDFECNGGERPPLDELERKRPKAEKAKPGEKVLSMEIEALGHAVHIPVPERAHGKFIRITVEVLK